MVKSKNYSALGCPKKTLRKQIAIQKIRHIICGSHPKKFFLLLWSHHPCSRIYLYLPFSQQIFIKALYSRKLAIYTSGRNTSLYQRNHPLPYHVVRNFAQLFFYFIRLKEEIAKTFKISFVSRNGVR